jgi:YihY family inner membrane protein
MRGGRWYSLPLDWHYRSSTGSGRTARTLRRWITWGSAFAAVIWIAASLLFSWYTANFGSYNKTYGSLGAVIGFMTWMSISTIVILLGAEIDAVMERWDRGSAH